MQCNTSVVDIVKRTIANHGMIAKGESVLVGLSGGADSVCLLHCLYKIKDELGIKVMAAHLNHKIRGAEANRDQDFACRFCRELGINFFSESADIPMLAETEGVSQETAGRLARYRFFSQIRKKHKIDKVATAHNSNDQAETILMRIIRGTGIDGLAGIKYCRDDGVIRPLLDVERDRIEEYCEENRLDYCTDSTNCEESYTRNRVRSKLIPMLKNEFNPNVVKALVVLSNNMSEDGAFINGYADRLYKRINCPLPSKKPVVLDIETLKMVDACIGTRLIKNAIRDADNGNCKPERVHIEAIFDLLEKETGAATVLPGGLSVSVKYGWLAFESQEDRKVNLIPDNLSVEVDSEGEYIFDNKKIIIKYTDKKIKLKPNQLLLDYDKICDKKMVLRRRRNGDRFSVFKDGRTKKLKNFMIDEKIPSEQRDKIPLLCSENEILAVIGYRTAEPYKANPKTKKGLVITYETKDFSR